MLETGSDRKTPTQLAVILRTAMRRAMPSLPELHTPDDDSTVSSARRFCRTQEVWVAEVDGPRRRLRRSRVTRRERLPAAPLCRTGVPAESRSRHRAARRRAKARASGRIPARGSSRRTRALAASTSGTACSIVELTDGSRQRGARAGRALRVGALRAGRQAAVVAKLLRPRIDRAMTSRWISLVPS